MSRILIVDDEHAIGWSLRELLSDDGHAVEVAADVQSALDACARLPPDAILLDVRLGSQDGLAALPDLRKAAGAVPVVVMTAFGDLDTAVRAVQAGAVEGTRQSRGDDARRRDFDRASVSGLEGGVGPVEIADTAQQRAEPAGHGAASATPLTAETSRP